MVNIGRRERRKGMSLVLLLVASFWATPTCLAQQVAPYPPGVYGMWPVAALNTMTMTYDPVHISNSQTNCVPYDPNANGTGRGYLLLHNPGVVGILLEVPWTLVQTGSNPASYDWSAMDEVLMEAQACGLPVALSLDIALDYQAQAGPSGLPPWVVNQFSPTGPIQTVNLDIGTVPVFWDTTFNSDRVGFIQAAAAHIATLCVPVSPTLCIPVAPNIVAVLAQPFGARTDDWNIPTTDSDVSAWLAAANSTSTSQCMMSGAPQFQCLMFGAAQTILNAAADAFSPPTQANPTPLCVRANFPCLPLPLNLKLPIHEEGTALDGTNPMTGTDVALATQVLSWAYGSPNSVPPIPAAFPGRFFAQLNFVRANTNPSAPNCATLVTSTTPCPVSPPSCDPSSTTCPLDPNVNPHSPYSVFELIRQYQPQVGLQDVSGAVDGAVDGCVQYATAPCTPCGTDAICTGTISGTSLSVTSCSFGTLHVNDTIAGTDITQPAHITMIGSCASPPGACTLNASQSVKTAETIPAQPPMAPTNTVQYATVSQNTWDVVDTYKPRFWEINFDDATTTTGSANPCPITTSGPTSGQAMMRAVLAAATTQLEGLAVTASGLAYSRVSQTFNGTVTIQNVSSSTIDGPFAVLCVALTSGVTLANAAGTYNGTQYVTLNAGSLAPGQTATAAVRFNNPAFGTINFTPLVYPGSLVGRL